MSSWIAATTRCSHLRSRAPARLLLAVVALLPASTAQAQWPDETSVYRQTTRFRWMNARQSPAFTRWHDATLAFYFDSARTTTGGTTLRLTPRSSWDAPRSVLAFQATDDHHLVPGTFSGPNSALAWDLVPSFHPARLAAGVRWTDSVDQTSTEDSLTTRLSGTRVSTLVRDTLVNGTRLWLVRDTLRGSYQEVRVHRESGLTPDAKVERNTEGMLTGEYLVNAESRLVAERIDTASFHGTAILSYPDGRVFRTTTTFERVRHITGHSRVEYDSVRAEAVRNAPRFSMFIEPTNALERRLAAGDIALRDSVLDEYRRSRDVDHRLALARMIFWGAGTQTPAFSDTMAAYHLQAGDTALVIAGHLSLIRKPLTAEGLALVLPLLRDPGLAFEYGVPAHYFYSDVAQWFTTYPPAIEHRPPRQLCTPEACAQLVALYNTESEPRLRRAAQLAGFAIDPLTWIDSVRDVTEPGGLYNLVHGVAASGRVPYRTMPTEGAGWRSWAEWMTGLTVPDNITPESGSAPRLVFVESHHNAAAFQALLSQRDFRREWQAGLSQAGSALERYVFETMLASGGHWRPDADSVASWLNDGTAIGRARGELGAPRVLADAPPPDSATVTALIDRILADELRGEEPWERVRMPTTPGLIQTPPRSGWGGRGYTIYVVSPMVTEELRAMWGDQVTWVTDPAWRLAEEMSPAVVITISGLGARGPLARISARISSFRKEGDFNHRTLSGDSYFLLRTATGWRRVGGDSWVV